MLRGDGLNGGQMMWSLRRAIAVIGAVGVLASANVASAEGRPQRESGRIVSPNRKINGWTGGELIGEGWYSELSLPVEMNPVFGNGEKCVKLGRNQVLLAIGTAPITCTVAAGTAVFVIGITSFCDDVEPEPYFAVSEAAQRDCTWASLKADTTSIRAAVDGGPTTNLMMKKYEACSPQREVQLLDDNFLGVDAQRAMFTACGWVAWLVDLSVGVHTLRSVTTFSDGSEHVYEPVIKVVRDG